MNKILGMFIALVLALGMSFSMVSPAAAGENPDETPVGTSTEFLFEEEVYFSENGSRPRRIKCNNYSTSQTRDSGRGYVRARTFYKICHPGLPKDRFVRIVSYQGAFWGYPSNCAVGNLFRGFNYNFKFGDNTGEFFNPTYFSVPCAEDGNNSRTLPAAPHERLEFFEGPPWWHADSTEKWCCGVPDDKFTHHGNLQVTTPQD